ncbi:MAG: VanZ family protein [Lachnospiraceae bacterium]|nr:VanZ family protein [Lachnospiraceae bacterium]
MSAIVRYVIKMMPYMMLAIPAYLIIRTIFVKVKKIKVNWYREIVMFAFAVFVVGLASQTIIPKIEIGENGFAIAQNGIHETNLIPFRVFVETYNEVFVNGHVTYFLINILGNIILFMPFGLVIPLLWKVSCKRTLVIGFCTSLFIEVSQMFLKRVTDIDDLMLNTMGVLLGVMVYSLLKRCCKTLIGKFETFSEPV